MFNTVQVGKKIAELRKAHNMTQFELADKLGISFQAVSNWERGNSMPDISKLPEIAELFSVSIDEILGKRNGLLTEILQDDKVELEKYSEEEINEAATVMQPQQIAKMIDIFDVSESSNDNIKGIGSLLPFLDKKYIEELVDKFRKSGKSIKMFLPFLSYSKIDSLVCECIQKGERINYFLPFLHKNRVRELAFAAFEKDGMKAISPYLPFISEKDIKLLAEKFLSEEE